MNIDQHGLALGLPLAASILEVADQLLLLVSTEIAGTLRSTQS
jgi:hypothetical protein